MPLVFFLSTCMHHLLQPGVPLVAYPQLSAPLGIALAADALFSHSPFPGWPISSTWLTWGCKGLTLTPQLRRVRQATPASELSVEPSDASTRWKHSLRCHCAQSPSFPFLPPSVRLQNTPSRTSCTVLPISESASWGPSYGNNVMTILQAKETEP